MVGAPVHGNYDELRDNRTSQSMAHPHGALLCASLAVFGGATPARCAAPHAAVHRARALARHLTRQHRTLPTGCLGRGAAQCDLPLGEAVHCRLDGSAIGCSDAVSDTSVERAACIATVPLEMAGHGRGLPSSASWVSTDVVSCTALPRHERMGDRLDARSRLPFCCATSAPATMRLGRASARRAGLWRVGSAS